MNKWLLLLIVIGLAGVGWINRDKVSEFLSSRGIAIPILQPASTPVPPTTPAPALEAKAQAVKAYPALGIQGSAFNRKFVALFNDLKDSDPDYLAQSDWPVRLAERTARELGDGAMPIAGSPTPRPVMVPMQDNTLDPKPAHGATPPAGGSMLDQPPRRSR